MSYFCGLEASRSFVCADFWRFKLQKKERILVRYLKTAGVDCRWCGILSWGIFQFSSNSGTCVSLPVFPTYRCVNLPHDTSRIAESNRVANLVNAVCCLNQKIRPLGNLQLHVCIEGTCQSCQIRTMSERYYSLRRTIGLFLLARVNNQKYVHNEGKYDGYIFILESLVIMRVA